MAKLNIYGTSRRGSVQGAKLWHESIPHPKFGNIISPKDKAEEDDLERGPALGNGYWLISPEDLKGEGDLRINRIFTPDKVDKLFALPEKEQISVIQMINENFDSLIIESLNPSPSGKAKEPEAKETQESKIPGGNKQITVPIPFDKITLKELQDILKEAKITFDEKANKTELYNIVYPDTK